MDDAIFNDLLKSTKDMVKHARGEAIQGVTVTELPEVDIKQVRERCQPNPHYALYCFIGCGTISFLRLP